MSQQDQTISQSPLDRLEASSGSKLGPGELGVVLARAGVGKTACLVQFALDAQERGLNVFHVSVGDDLERVQSWYKTLFEDRLIDARLNEREAPALTGKRIFHTFPNTNIRAEKLDAALEVYSQHTQFSPDVIIVDGFDWTESTVRAASKIGALKALAARHSATLWMTAQTHRESGSPPAGLLHAPCTAYSELIEMALGLIPNGEQVGIGLFKAPNSPEVLTDPALVVLQRDTMRIASAMGEKSHVKLPSKVCTLLSGGAGGAEEAFGKCAEQYGVQEINYSFAGRPVVRDRGLVLLNAAQLAQGKVGDRYLQEHMQRNFPKTPLFQKVLQSIWHEVNTANQVFVVGLILENGTVKGGTGWAAELAKHLKKSLHVFDQERRAWFTWSDDAWVEESDARIRARRFTGTGTRDLSQQGREAIEALFERSFA